MNWLPGPSVAEERAEGLRHLVSAAPATPWRVNGILLRIVFSIAAWVAVNALFELFKLLHMPKGWLTAVLAIGTAEWLIRRYHFFRTGLESALLLGGTFAFIFGLPSSGKIEAILVFAAAAALSGWRMRNSIFGVIAAMLVVVYVAGKWDREAVLTMSVASLMAIVAAFALRRVWQRPSNERLFAGLVLTMPAVGYLASILLRGFRPGHSWPNIPIALLLATTAFVLAAAGIAWRDRILLLSAAFATSLTAIELRGYFHYSAEVKLIAGGAIVIAIAALLSRLLRGATHGFVVTPVRAGAYEEAMQIGGIISVPHGFSATPDHSGPDLTDSSNATDKSFGGAGAGGGY